jgi:membrane protein implicated in regulation of membrane protease activity
MPAAVYIVFAIGLLIGVYFLWRYWADMVDRSPEEAAYERRISALNERQANRYSDDELTDVPSEDEAWRIMVERGQRVGRRDRYGGDLRRRARERRRK